MEKKTIAEVKSERMFSLPGLDRGQGLGRASALAMACRCSREKARKIRRGWRVYTVKECAIETGLSPGRIRQAIRRGKLGRKIGGVYIVTDDELEFIISRKGRRGRRRNGK